MTAAEAISCGQSKATERWRGSSSNRRGSFCFTSTAWGQAVPPGLFEDSVIAARGVSSGIGDLDELPSSLRSRAGLQGSMHDTAAVGIFIHHVS
jgi:hypothetical protein